MPLGYASWSTGTKSAASLFLDPRNPRIPPSPKPLSEPELIEQLVSHDDVYELAKSIALNDFFPSEPLVVVREDRRLIVIEGNRRLAACKLLVSPEAAPEDFRDRFKVLAAKVDQNTLKAIPIVIAPSRAKTVPLVIARHTAAQIERWAPAMQANFYNNLLGQGMSIEDVAREFNQTVGKIRESLYSHNLYQMACRLDLPDGKTEIVRKPRKFALTNLQRIFETPVGRDFFGVKFRDDGTIEGYIDPKEFEKGFAKAVADVATGAADSRVLNTPDDIKRYLDSFSPSERPDSSKKAVFDSTSFLTGLTVKTVPKAAREKKKTTAAPKPVGLAPRSFQSKIAVRRVQDLLAELKKLRPGKFPNACALALRCFLELSVFCFLYSKGEVAKMRAEAEKEIAKKNAGRPPDRQIPSLPSDWTPPLEQMLKWITDPQRTVLPQPHVIKALGRVIQDEKALFELNLYSHNPAYVPSERRLRESWANFEELLKAIHA